MQRAAYMRTRLRLSAGGVQQFSFTKSATATAFVTRILPSNGSVFRLQTYAHEKGRNLAIPGL
ncbi:MAG: hypothetical protein DMG59_20875 [Acidobacteria bacterium]|nr:MAG: hypothetical protein DMG59_20875 [Acidobacteriota bacterium]